MFGARVAWRAMIPRRSANELALMRRAGKVVAEMHEVTRVAIRPGITTGDLDRLARDVIERRGATSITNSASSAP